MAGPDGILRQELGEGVAHRGTSIRIPQPVTLKGYGHVENRRRNADTYRVAACLVRTVCLAPAGSLLPRSLPRWLTEPERSDQRGTPCPAGHHA
jgi:hypothetical protein